MWWADSIPEGLVMAIENGPSIDDFTIKHGGYDGLWMFMVVYGY